MYTESVQLQVPQHQVSVLRLDLFHPITGGNKHFKLKYNLENYLKSGLKGIVTMGGAYSNHIAATAAACFEQQIPSIGIIRGEEPKELNSTLVRAKDQGMQLHFVSRTDYREYRSSEKMKSVFPDYYSIPEGGNNAEGVRGCEEILAYADGDFEIIITGCGTGATLAGIVKSLTAKSRAIGINVTKSGNSLEEALHLWLNSEEINKFSIANDYHFGGYAKQNAELKEFIHRFNQENHFLIEHVYTGKVFYAVEDLLRNEVISSTEKILVVHTGGLQYLL